MNQPASKDNRQHKLTVNPARNPVVRPGKAQKPAHHQQPAQDIPSDVWGQRK